MDITLIKTFLEVSATGSFVSASDRLYVTQSAVSLRIQRLESSLGRPLFTRSKAGAELTPAGREFEHYALSLLKIWEEARQQIAIPEGFTRSLCLGAQYSLWPRLGFRWIDALREQMPDLNMRAELGMPDRLTRFLIEGVVQVALMYTPHLRPGLTATEVLGDELILVSTDPEAKLESLKGYIYLDWGPEFTHAHAIHLPDLINSGLTMSLGALGADYIVNRRGCAYLPARYVKRHLDAEVLHLVPNAPVFPYPVWAVWREDLDPEIANVAQETLSKLTKDLDIARDEVLIELRGLNSMGDINILGESNRNTTQ
jgi:DNA-binding transcriptional LysR family regulator